TVDTIGENIVLGGQAANPAEAKTAMDLAVKFAGDEKKVMSTINVTGKEQVMLRVRVAEVQRDVLKQLGVNTAALFSIGKFALGWTSVNPFTANPNGNQTSSVLGLGYNDFNCSGNSVNVGQDSGCAIIQA